MNDKLERIIIAVAVVSFIFTSICLLSIREIPLTREEAIEISKGSSLVKEGLAKSRYTTIETHHYNSQRIEELKEWHSDIFWGQKVPEGRSVWEIIWYFSRGIGGYNVIVIVDAEIGAILSEEKGIEFL